MNIPIYKYHGTGNDFIMINGIEDRSFLPFLTKDRIMSLCQRRFGIGADGLIIATSSKNSDYRMIYYNADGNESSMCGNGGRCIAQFVYDLELIGKEQIFDAIDGVHTAEVSEEVELKMSDVRDINIIDRLSITLDTGSPHIVKLVESLPKGQILDAAHAIRYNNDYSEDGINVNFVQILDGNIHVRTYERGVENETYSCGTGAVAASIAVHNCGLIDNNKIKVITQGGPLEVRFNSNESVYTEVYLKGPAIKVFESEIHL